MGRVHRAVRDGGADRYGDGDLLEGGSRTEKGAVWTADARKPYRSCNGRRCFAFAPESDDGQYGSCRSAADYVEHKLGRRGNETACDTRAWRYGVVSRPCVDCHTGDLFLAARARGATRREGSGGST